MVHWLCRTTPSMCVGWVPCHRAVLLTYWRWFILGNGKSRNQLKSRIFLLYIYLFFYFPHFFAFFFNLHKKIRFKRVLTTACARGRLSLFLLPACCGENRRYVIIQKMKLNLPSRTAAPPGSRRIPSRGSLRTEANRPPPPRSHTGAGRGQAHGERAEGAAAVPAAAAPVARHGAAHHHRVPGHR